MSTHSEKGLWPVMLTPFTQEGEIDYPSLERLIAWYEENGAEGLFAACQSSEIFFLSLKERVELVRFVKSHAHVPVIASGHTAWGAEDQIAELKEIASAGPDALILITNRLVPAGRQQASMLPMVRRILEAATQDMPLGFYECPYPFKRLITLEELEWCAGTGRFAFMKDTCCDIELIQKRLDVLRGTSFRLYNANTTTLLSSLRAGAAGFSGVMLNFHPALYRMMVDSIGENPERAAQIQHFLTLFSEIERQYYPVNAKFHLTEIAGVIASDYARVIPAEGLTETFKTEVRHMDRAVRYLLDHI